MPGLWEEIWKSTLVKLRLSDHAALEQRLSCCVEGSVEEGEEGDGILREDLLVGLVDGAQDVHSLDDGIDASHFEGCSTLDFLSRMVSDLSMVKYKFRDAEGRRYMRGGEGECIYGEVHQEQRVKKSGRTRSI